MGKQNVGFALYLEIYILSTLFYYLILYHKKFCIKMQLHRNYPKCTLQVSKSSLKTLSLFCSKEFFVQIGLFSPLFKVASHNWNCCSIFVFFLTQSNFSLPTLSVTHFTMNDFYSKLLQNADDGGGNYSGTGCSIWNFIKISACKT